MDTYKSTAVLPHKRPFPESAYKQLRRWYPVLPRQPPKIYWNLYSNRLRDNFLEFLKEVENKLRSEGGEINEGEKQDLIYKHEVLTSSVRWVDSWVAADKEKKQMHPNSSRMTTSSSEINNHSSKKPKDSLNSRTTSNKMEGQAVPTTVPSTNRTKSVMTRAAEEGITVEISVTLTDISEEHGPQSETINVTLKKLEGSMPVAAVLQAIGATDFANDYLDFTIPTGQMRRNKNGIPINYTTNLRKVGWGFKYADSRRIHLIDMVKAVQGGLDEPILRCTITKPWKDVEIYQPPQIKHFQSVPAKEENHYDGSRLIWRCNTLISQQQKDKESLKGLQNLVDNLQRELSGKGSVKYGNFKTDAEAAEHAKRVRVKGTTPPEAPAPTQHQQFKVSRPQGRSKRSRRRGGENWARTGTPQASPSRRAEDYGRLSRSPSPGGSSRGIGRGRSTNRRYTLETEREPSQYFTQSSQTAISEISGSSVSPASFKDKPQLLEAIHEPQLQDPSSKKYTSQTEMSKETSLDNQYKGETQFSTRTSSSVGSKHASMQGISVKAASDSNDYKDLIFVFKKPATVDEADENTALAQDDGIVKDLSDIENLTFVAKRREEYNKQGTPRPEDKAEVRGDQEPEATRDSPEQSEDEGQQSTTQSGIKKASNGDESDPDLTFVFKKPATSSDAMQEAASGNVIKYSSDDKSDSEEDLSLVFKGTGVLKPAPTGKDQGQKVEQTMMEHETSFVMVSKEDDDDSIVLEFKPTKLTRCKPVAAESANNGINQELATAPTDKDRRAQREFAEALKIIEALSEAPSSAHPKLAAPSSAEEAHDGEDSGDYGESELSFKGPAMVQSSVDQPHAAGTTTATAAPATGDNDYSDDKEVLCFKMPANPTYSTPRTTKPTTASGNSTGSEMDLKNKTSFFESLTPTKQAQSSPIIKMEPKDEEILCFSAPAHGSKSVKASKVLSWEDW